MIILCKKKNYKFSTNKEILVKLLGAALNKNKTTFSNDRIPKLQKREKKTQKKKGGNKEKKG